MSNHYKEYSKELQGHFPVRVKAVNNFSVVDGRTDFVNAGNFPSIKYITFKYTGGLILLNGKPLELTGLRFDTGETYDDIFIEYSDLFIITTIGIIDTTYTVNGIGSVYMDTEGNISLSKPSGDYIGLGVNDINMVETNGVNTRDGKVVGNNYIAKDFSKVNILDRRTTSSTLAYVEEHDDNTIFHKVKEPLSILYRNNQDLDLLYPTYQTENVDMTLHLMDRPDMQKCYNFKEIELLKYKHNDFLRLLLPIKSVSDEKFMIFHNNKLVYAGNTSHLINNKRFHLLDVNNLYGIKEYELKRLMYIDDTYERNLELYDTKTKKDKYNISVVYIPKETKVFSSFSKYKNIIIPPKSIFNAHQIELYINGLLIHSDEWREISFTNGTTSMRAIEIRRGIATDNFHFTILGYKETEYEISTATKDTITRFAFDNKRFYCKIFHEGHYVNMDTISFSDYHHLILSDSINDKLEIHRYFTDYEDGVSFLDPYITAQIDTIEEYRLNNLVDIGNKGATINQDIKTQFFLQLVNTTIEDTDNLLDFKNRTDEIGTDIFSDLYGLTYDNEKDAYEDLVYTVGGRFYTGELTWDYYLYDFCSIYIDNELFALNYLRFNIGVGNQTISTVIDSNEKIKLNTPFFISHNDTAE